MRISNLADKTDTPIDTLRYWEKLGLVSNVGRSEGGYRNYTDENLRQVQFIQRAKSVGFSLAEIEELLCLRTHANMHSCQEVKDIADQKIDEIALKIRELEQMRDALQRISAICCGGEEAATSCTILTALSEGGAL